VSVLFTYSMLILSPSQQRQSTNQRQSILLILAADYKDFASKYSTSTSERRQSKNPEGVAELMQRIRVWLTESPTAVINIQTVDHHAYYRSAIDAPGS